MRMQMTGEWAKLMNDINPSHTTKVVSDIDKEVGFIAKDISKKASADAPVDTGYMRATLKINYMPTGSIIDSEWQVMPDVYDVLPYLWMQNFNHATKGFFFTNAFNQQHAKFDKRLLAVIERAYK